MKKGLVVVQVDSTGKPITHSGWASNNFIPINGYDDPTAIFDFYYNVDPVIEECLVTQFNEDTAYDFSINDLKYSDEDDIADSKLKLTIAAGEHYTINGDTLQPEKNYNGKIQVPFQISDGLTSLVKKMDYGLHGMIMEGRNLNQLTRMVKKMDYGLVEFVWDRNYHRRNLSPGQRAGCSLKFEKQLAKEAKERMTAGINQYSSPVEKIAESEKGGVG